MIAKTAILHVLLSVLTAMYCVSAGESECVLEQAARGASTKPCLHGFFSPSEYAESEHEANSLQLLQVASGKLRVAPVCGVLWFYHIPKTGGTSVKAWLDGLKKDGALEDVFNLNDNDPVINFTAFHEEKIRPLLRNMKGKLVAVHHHHHGPGLYGMDSYFSDVKKKLSSQGCSLTRLTVLREPVSNFMSASNYLVQISQQREIPMHLQNVSARDDFFREQCGKLRRDNAQVRYILNNFADEMDDEGSEFPMPLGGSNEDALKAAEAILDGFEVVGLMEELEKSLGKVAELLKLPNVEVPHENARAASHQKYDDQPLPDDVNALIKERTKFDSKLYARFLLAAMFSE